MHDALHLSRRAAAAAVLAASVLIATPTARAHGAFPSVLQVVGDPSDASRVWARATYGVLTSDDAGASWRWLCTTAAGYAPTDEPTFALTATGTLLMATFDGLLASGDHGCGWASPAPSLARSVTGMAIDAKNPSRIVVLLSEGVTGGTFASELWQSLDAGATFQALGPSLDPSTLFLSVGISASDPLRLYLSGLPGAGGGKSVVLRSADSGQSWQSADLPSTPGGAAYVAGVHPGNPDVVYVRANFTGSASSEGALLASGDGGKSFSEVLKKNAPLMGFAFSPDGSKAFAGYGSPRGGVVVEEAALGLYSALTDDNAFSLVHPGPVACVSWIGGELWACTSQFYDGFEIGRSADDGQTFTPVMELAGLTGPLECPATSTVGTTCTSADWDHVCRDTGKCSAGTGGQGTADPGDEGGCGCRTAGRDSPLALGALGLMMLTWMRRMRQWG